MHSREFFSRVMEAASRSCLAVPPVEASLKSATVLPVSVEETPASTLVDRVSWVIDEPLLDCLVAEVFDDNSSVFRRLSPRDELRT